MALTKTQFLAKLLRERVFRDQWAGMTHAARKQYLERNVGLTTAEADQLDAYNEYPADDQAVLAEIGTAVQTAFWG